jgi:DNA-directed RNA polymerase specialized sigma24 family protein
MSKRQTSRRQFWFKVPPQVWEGLDWTQPDAVIARQIGCARQNVQAKRRALGRRVPIAEKRRRQFAALPRGLSPKEIGEQLGIGEKTARDWCERLGYEPRGYHSIRKERAAKIARFPPGLTYKQIARRLGMSPRHGRLWALRFGYCARYVGKLANVTRRLTRNPRPPS